MDSRNLECHSIVRINAVREFTIAGLTQIETQPTLRRLPQRWCARKYAVAHFTMVYWPSYFGAAFRLPEFTPRFPL